MSEETTQPATAPAVASSALLADAYRQVTQLWDRLNDAQWSRGMTRKDHQQVAEFQTKLHNLLNTLYRATQANAKRSHAGPMTLGKQPGDLPALADATGSA